MHRRLDFTRRASNQFNAIGAYLSKHNPKAANYVLARILEITEHLCLHPQMGRDGRVRGTRELIIPDISYIIAYRVTADAVAIVAILHSSQSWPKHL